MPATLRTFDENDWNAFSGCESDEPQIAELGRSMLIVDGSVLTVIKTGVFGTIERFADHGTPEKALAGATHLINCFNSRGPGCHLNRLIRDYASNIR